ncbi:MAG: TIGR03761 family integrating conjugative element protein [Candidatus Thiodiazotropha sp. (ex Lucinoma borealis)]|nr:TIGR03761 family integrating conjugative element protein [Candidatus Thiodiazotropha sp. (ex Lucinoma borealis)]
MTTVTADRLLHQQKADKPDDRHIDPVSATTGRLRASATLTLETLQGRLLFNGRKESEGRDRIIGLRGFGSLLTAIWHGAGKDCPWAWAHLVRIEERLNTRKAEIDSMVVELAAVMEAAPGLNHEEAHSIEPFVVTLRFSTPYSFIGAELLSEYDHLVRLAMQAHHTGRCGDVKTHRLINLGGKAVRSAFESAWGYKNSNLTTTDLLKKQKAKETQSMIETLGQVPESVLKGLHRPSFTPRPLNAFTPTFFRYSVTQDIESSDQSKTPG